MIKNISIAAVILSFLTFQVFSAPRYPFPQNKSYPYGIKASTASAGDVQSVYSLFVTEYYEESDQYARIKWDQTSQTVSEGVAYGMLIMVYMDNSTNKTQSKFDKLWNYYKKWVNNRGLMHWKINGFSNVAAQNAATDAELDAALALIMAYKQWGDQKYLNDAKDLVGKIWRFEVNDNGYLKPGDAWDDKKNPSYFSTAALELFKKVDGNNWSQVISNSYGLLKKCRNSSTGLVPDWCKENGDALGDYRYDAARTPWRIAMAYSWFGHADAKDIAGKMASWIKGKTGGDPKKIVDSYALNGGNLGSYNNPTFVGPFAVAGMVASSHQSWVNNGYDRLKRFSSDDGYYNECLQLVTMLLLSGNMPNFWDLSSPVIHTVKKDNAAIADVTVRNNPSQDRCISIHYSIPQSCRVSFTVMDVRGKLIKNCSKGFKEAGTHTGTLDLSKEGVPSGMYIVRMRAGTGLFSGSFVIAK